MESIQLDRAEPEAGRGALLVPQGREGGGCRDAEGRIVEEELSAENQGLSLAHPHGPPSFHSLL